MRFAAQSAPPLLTLLEARASRRPAGVRAGLAMGSSEGIAVFPRVKNRESEGDGWAGALSISVLALLARRKG